MVLAQGRGLARMLLGRHARGLARMVLAQGRGLSRMLLGPGGELARKCLGRGAGGRGAPQGGGAAQDWPWNGFMRGVGGPGERTALSVERK